MAVTVNEQAPGCAVDHTMVIMRSRAGPVPESVPPLLFRASGNVLCQVPVSCLFVWEMVNTSIPLPARLSWSVPVQVPVKGGVALSLEQPRRTTTRATAHHRHGLHCMEALS